MRRSPVQYNEQGEPFGTLVQDLATWCITDLQLDVTMLTTDFEIIDLSWDKLSRDEVLERLRAVRDIREVKELDKHFSQVYVQRYIDFLEAGGNLVIRSWIGREYLATLLEEGPVHISVGSNTNAEHGRSHVFGTRELRLDDVHGSVFTHSVALYGIVDNGNFLVADPWSGKKVVEPDHLLAAFSTAAFLCDNILFQVHPRNIATQITQA